MGLIVEKFNDILDSREGTMNALESSLSSAKNILAQDKERKERNKMILDKNTNTNSNIKANKKESLESAVEKKLLADVSLPESLQEFNSGINTGVNMGIDTRGSSLSAETVLEILEDT